MNIIPHPLLLASSFFIATLSCSVAQADANQHYLENAGFILFETEDAEVPADWKLNNEIDGFRGTGYLEWSGPDYFSKNNAGNGAISYSFRIETAGNYELRWRSRIAKGDSNTESNDSWARFVTGSNVTGEEALNGWTKVYMGESNTWSWSARTVDQVARPIRQYFNQGDHTVEISGRSYGHAIDQIALYRYLDVSFDSALNGTLPLSLIMQEDGTTTDPNPVVIPDTQFVLAERDNVESIAANTLEPGTAICVANTLTLPAINVASYNILDEAVDYNVDELPIEAVVKRVLLAYDLSQLPPFTTASIHYSTGMNASNGSLDIFLGSHSEWPVNTNLNAPDAMVKVATARGGWDTESSYASELVALLLPRELTTLILSTQAGSDTLELAATKAARPMLVVSGDNNFCSDWEANSIEQEQQMPAVEEPTAIVKKSKSGSFDLWLGLLLLAGFSDRVLRQNPKNKLLNED